MQTTIVLRAFVLSACVVGGGACRRPDAPLSVGGIWASVFNGATGAGGAPLTLVLAQSGTHVTGSYQQAPGPLHADPGTLSGELSGAQLRGTWRDSAGSSGPFQFVFSSDGRSFNGYWVSSSRSGPWSGTRAP
jgi:hypothetical protein